MTRDQLEHAIRAACDVSEDTELWIFGSQAILGEFPDAHENLRASIEVDVQPKNRPEAVDYVDGALGELSQFHETHGFYVHGISIESAKLPNSYLNVSRLHLLNGIGARLHGQHVRQKGIFLGGFCR